MTVDTRELTCGGEGLRAGRRLGRRTLPADNWASRALSGVEVREKCRHNRSLFLDHIQLAVTHDD